MKLFNLSSLTTTVAVAASLASGAALSQTSNPYQRGPNPTTAALEASRGSFTTSQFTVTRPNGYRAGTVYYPTNAGGTVGAIAVAPGFLARQNTINWWGPRLASHGFVVITIDTSSTSDQPAARARQLMAALRQVVALNGTSSSPIYNKVDASRLAVMGWSMGGGGALIAARDNPTLKAAVPFAPYATGTSLSTAAVPALIIGCENDTVAPVGRHGEAFYNSMTRPEKAYLEINGGSHTCANSGNRNQAVIGKYGVSWLKRFVDNDTRFSDFLCGAPHAADLRNTSVISGYRETCPY